MVFEFLTFDEDLFLNRWVSFILEYAEVTLRHPVEQAKWAKLLASVLVAQAILNHKNNNASPGTASD